MRSAVVHRTYSSADENLQGIEGTRKGSGLCSFSFFFLFLWLQRAKNQRCRVEKELHHQADAAAAADAVTSLARWLLAVGEVGGSGTESARAPHLPIFSIRQGRQVGSAGDPLHSFAFVPSKFRLFPLTSSSSLPRSALIRSALVPTEEVPLCLRHARQMQNPAPECREMTSPRESRSSLQPQ